MKSINTAQYETGGSIILLVRFYGVLHGTRDAGYFWAPIQSDLVHPNGAGPVQFATREAALAAAQKFVAAQQDPSAWDIVG